MAYIVQKFGGTSLSTLELIKKAALRVKSEVESGHKVVVTVSAMAGSTNTLVGYVRDLSTTYDRAEYDCVVSSGEQVTAGLLALCLQNLDIPARSWLGWQIPIYTSSHHSQGKIERINIKSLVKELDKGIVAVVAGFQGLSAEGRITTLGRGGSDTTAVALAAALKAERCDIFTDVDGVYTADPRYVTTAGKFEHIAYQEMLELAAQGAKVLQKDSVELAMHHGVRLRVLSSLSETSGTLITNENELTESEKHIRGVAHTLSEEKLTLRFVSQNATEIDEVKALLEEDNISINMIQYHISICRNFIDLSFTISVTEIERIIEILQKAKKKLKFYDLLRSSRLARVSVIGAGLQTDHSSARKLFQILREENIEVQSVAASDIKLSVLLSVNDAERAIKCIHAVYQLG